MLFNKPRILIAGLKGGSGKTTLTLGLLRHWKKSGKSVVPFKKGPDYIDAAWLAEAAGSKCYNLDSFLIPENLVLDSVIKHSQDADIVVIEGNRGLFDGVDVNGTFSTAALSKLANTPVILIVDCTKATNTIGVIIKGINDFDQNLSIKGVILNYVANKRHEKIITEAVEKHAGLPVVGVLHKQSASPIPERHMGLVSKSEFEALDKALDTLASTINTNVNVKHIEDISAQAVSLTYSNTIHSKSTSGEHVRIGVVRDRAFQFYYPENIELLTDSGAEIVELSAMESPQIPDLHALYIGGGFPETNAIGLAENTSFIEALNKKIEDGLPVYAECGGLMFLGRSIIYKGITYPMAGVFPADFLVEEKPQAHGYTVVEVIGECPFYKVGSELKGHEFHYSRLVEDTAGPLKFAFRMNRGKGVFNGYDGLVYKNVLATYTHLHAYGSNKWLDGMLMSAISYKHSKYI